MTASTRPFKSALAEAWAERTTTPDPEFVQATAAFFETVDEETFGLGSVVVERRNQLEWSQRRLALEAGVQQAELSRLENGQLNPTWTTVRKIFDALSLDLRVVSR